MNRTHTWRLVAVLSVVAITAMACGKDDNNASSTTAGGSSSTTTGSFINPKEDCKDYKPTQGISDGTITVGTVRPAEGPYAIYDTVTKGIEKYFDVGQREGRREGRRRQDLQAEPRQGGRRLRPGPHARPWSRSSWSRTASSPWSVRSAPRPRSPSGST